MAAELSGRVCCGLELDPKYVEVIIERWQKLTGKQAKLDGAGGTFHEVQLGRRQSTEEAVEENVAAPPGGQREEEIGARSSGDWTTANIGSRRQMTGNYGGQR
jgi:hypothetical protein